MKDFWLQNGPFLLDHGKLTDLNTFWCSNYCFSSFPSRTVSRCVVFPHQLVSKAPPMPEASDVGDILLSVRCLTPLGKIPLWDFEIKNITPYVKNKGGQVPIVYLEMRPLCLGCTSPVSPRLDRSSARGGSMQRQGVIYGSVNRRIK